VQRFVIGSRAPRARSVIISWRSLAMLAVLVCSARPSLIWASGILPAAISTIGNASGGAVVAEPPSPAEALYANPAGLSGFEQTTLSGGLALMFASQDIEATAPAGYRESDSLFAQAPDLGLVVAGHGRWSYGLGAHGNAGSSFDFGADSGVDSFFAELQVFGAPLGLAYQLSDTISLGAAVVPLYGMLTSRYTLPSPQGGQRFSYHLKGPGLQGLFGVTWRVDSRWLLGASWRTPGRIWMDDRMTVSGLGRQDVDLTIKMPAQLSAGVTHKLSARTHISAAIRWTDADDFGNSIIAFERTPAADTPLVPDAADEWRFALAGSYRCSDHLELFSSVSYASRIVGNRGVSPLLYDGEDTRIGLGLAWSLERWRLEMMVGHQLESRRDVAPPDALVLPGRYTTGGNIVQIGFQRRL